MPPASITLAFNPVLDIGDLEVRAVTVLLAGIFLGALVLAARMGRLTPQVSPFVPPPSLRLDDIPFLLLGIAPGAVIGGRLDYVLIHLDYYAANPLAIVDPAQGGLALGFAAAGGILGGVAIAGLIGASAGRWMHAAALPVLLALAAGKLAAVVAGEGQGAPSDLPWATAFKGPGPWASLAPEIPSHPSQVYEALATMAALVVVACATRAGLFPRRDGSALLAGVALWSLGRGFVAFTWRDAPVAGPFLAEHLVLAVVIVGCVVGLTRLRLGGPPEASLRRR